MKSLLSFCLSFLVCGLVFCQDAPQWQHFYSSHAPANISTSSNRVAMTGGKGLIRYNIDSENIQHFNILDIPNMPTNDWSNVLENKAFDALWAVPTENQVKDLAPIYRYDKNDGNWVGSDLDSMFNAEFDYQKLGTSPQGRVLIPGVRMEADGTEKLLIAIHQNDHTWLLKTVMDNPGNFSAPIGSENQEYFIDAGIGEGIYATPSSWGQVIDLSENLSENYTPNHHLVDTRGDSFGQSAYFINDGIRIFKLDFLSSVDFVITEYETEDFGLPGNFIIDPKDVIFDRDRYFRAVGNEQLWRFKKEEATTNFSLADYEIDRFGDWKILMADRNADVWLSRRGTSKLWKYSNTNGMQSIDYGNAEMPIKGVYPVSLIGNHGLIFNSEEGTKVFKNGDFLDVDLELGGEDNQDAWSFTFPDKSVAYGKRETDQYFVQRINSNEREVFHPKTENGEVLLLAEIQDANSRGDLLAYTFPNGGNIRKYYLKKKSNDYWEALFVFTENNSTLSIRNLIFYDDDTLIGAHYSFMSNSSSLYWYYINAFAAPISEEVIEEETYSLSIVKSGEKIWIYGRDKLGLMIEDYPNFISSTDMGLLTNEYMLKAIPADNETIWIYTNRGRVILWDGENIINQFHTGNSGLQFKPEDIYLDLLNNLWMCKDKIGCTVYNEAGVDFDYKNIEDERIIKLGENPFVVSPNPVRDVLTICSTFDINSIKIYDALGREIANMSTNAVKN